MRTKVTKGPEFFVPFVPGSVRPFDGPPKAACVERAPRLNKAFSVVAVTLRLTEALPFAAASLLVLVLIAAFGIADYRTVVRAGFGDPIVTFILGAPMLSAAFTRSGLGTRLAHHVLLRVGTHRSSTAPDADRGNGDFHMDSRCRCAGGRTGLCWREDGAA